MSMAKCNLSKATGSTTKKNKNFMTPFYGCGSSASRLEPLRGGSLLYPAIKEILAILALFSLSDNELCFLLVNHKM